MRTLTVSIDVPCDATPRDLARTLERVARDLRATARLEHRDGPLRDETGAVCGRILLDMGQRSLFAAE